MESLGEKKNIDLEAIYDIINTINTKHK